MAGGGDGCKCRSRREGVKSDRHHPARWEIHGIRISVRARASKTSIAIHTAATATLARMYTQREENRSAIPPGFTAAPAVARATGPRYPPDHLRSNKDSASSTDRAFRSDPRHQLASRPIGSLRIPVHAALRSLSETTRAER